MATHRTARLTTLAFYVCLVGSYRYVEAQSATGHSPQELLDQLAKPLPAGSRMGLPASFPTLYQGWTEAQRQSGLQMLVQRCALLYSLEGDNPQAHLLPDTMTRREAAELAISVCLPSKMPADWPERQKYLGDARRLIAKANSGGAALQLPQNLHPTN